MWPFSRKADNTSWEGVVIGKHRGMFDGSNMYHRLKIRADDGTTQSVRVDRTLWKAISDGDRVRKRPHQPAAPVDRR